MISNQVIQNSIDELRAITKVDLGVFDVEGMKVAATTEDIDISGRLLKTLLLRLPTVRWWEAVIC